MKKETKKKIKEIIKFLIEITLIASGLKVFEFLFWSSAITWVQLAAKNPEYAEQIASLIWYNTIFFLIFLISILILWLFHIFKKEKK